MWKSFAATLNARAGAGSATGRLMPSSPQIYFFRYKTRKCFSARYGGCSAPKGACFSLTGPPHSAERDLCRMQSSEKRPRKSFFRRKDSRMKKALTRGRIITGWCLRRGRARERGGVYYGEEMQKVKILFMKREACNLKHKT